MSAYRYQPRHAAWLRTQETSTASTGSAVAVIERGDACAPAEARIDSK